MIAHSTSYDRPRRGMVLVLVLVVIAMLSLAALTYASLMLSEHQVSRTRGRQDQARELAESGLVAVQQLLSQTGDARRDAGGVYDNPSMLRGRVVVDNPSPSRRGRFTVIAPRFDSGQSGGARYGLEDESAKLNLNTLLAIDKSMKNGGRTALMNVPGMTEDVADAILDWLDTDETPRDQGAENSYYSGLNPPYSAKNNYFDTLEELLLVKGVTPQLLFGSDTNRNGVVDPGEPSSASGDGDALAASRGWSAYLTVSSYEANLRPDGTQRINVNSDDLEKLHADLTTAFGDEWANFIVAYRQFGKSTSTREGQSAAGIKLDLKQPGPTKFNTLLDLVGAKTQVRLNNQTNATPINPVFSPLPEQMNEYLTKLFDSATTSTESKVMGRININQAPRNVIMAIPGMTAEVADAIVSRRSAEAAVSQPERRYATWLLAERVVTLQQMQLLLPFVNTGGDVFRAQAVGYFDESGPAARLEAVVDATTSNPRIVFWKDLTPLGRGYANDVLGAATATQ